MNLRVAILTASDRSARGERADLSGPALIEVVRINGWTIVDQKILRTVPQRRRPHGFVSNPRHHDNRRKTMIVGVPVADFGQDLQTIQIRQAVIQKDAMRGVLPAGLVPRVPRVGFQNDHPLRFRPPPLFEQLPDQPAVIRRVVDDQDPDDFSVHTAANWYRRPRGTSTTAILPRHRPPPFRPRWHPVAGSFPNSNL